MKVKDDKILYNNANVEYQHDKQYVPNKKVTEGVTFRECEAFRGEEHVFRCAYKDEFVRCGTFLDKDSKPVEPTEIIKNARDFFGFLS